MSFQYDAKKKVLVWVLTEVNVSKWSAPDLPPEAVLVAHPQLHASRDVRLTAHPSLVRKKDYLLRSNGTACRIKEELQLKTQPEQVRNKIKIIIKKKVKSKCDGIEPWYGLWYLIIQGSSPSGLNHKATFYIMEPCTTAYVTLLVLTIHNLNDWQPSPSSFKTYWIPFVDVFWQIAHPGSNLMTSGPSQHVVGSKVENNQEAADPKDVTTGLTLNKTSGIILWTYEPEGLGRCLSWNTQWKIPQHLLKTQSCQQSNVMLGVWWWGCCAASGWAVIDGNMNSAVD